MECVKKKIFGTRYQIHFYFAHLNGTLGLGLHLHLLVYYKFRVDEALSLFLQVIFFDLLFLKQYISCKLTFTYFV